MNDPLDELEAAVHIWTVYRNPADYPGLYVARHSAADRDGLHTGPVVAVGTSLEQVRAALPPGLVRLDRHPTDDPVIVEVWL